MNYIITAAGRGERFLNSGIKPPKPLIKVLGNELLLWSLQSFEFNESDNLYLVTLKKDKVKDEDKHILNFRPGLIDFLNKIYYSFNLFVFTAGTESYADYVVGEICNKCENYNLFIKVLSRENLSQSIYNGENTYHKSLYDFYKNVLCDVNIENNELNRLIQTTIKKTIIIDNISYNFHTTPYNGLDIIDYTDSIYDNCLERLYPFLIEYRISNLDADWFIYTYKYKIQDILQNSINHFNNIVYLDNCLLSNNKHNTNNDNIPPIRIIDIDLPELPDIGNIPEAIQMPLLIEEQKEEKASIQE